MIGLQEYSPDMRGTVRPTGPVELNNSSFVLFDKSIEADKALQYLRIQNVDSAGVIYVNVGVDTASALVYTHILAADTADNAGNGGVAEIPGSWDVSKVTIFSAVAVKAAIMKVTNKGNSRIIN